MIDKLLTFNSHILRISLDWKELCEGLRVRASPGRPYMSNDRDDVQGILYFCSG